MVAKKLVRNLIHYLEPLNVVDIYSFDNHTELTIPRIVVGYSNETTSFPGNHGHYTVTGYVNIVYQGYDDLTCTDADSTSDQLIEQLCDRDSLESTLNKPLTGIDTRPLSGFGINQLIIRGEEREITDHSTTITINFDAFCAAKDF